MTKELGAARKVKREDQTRRDVASSAKSQRNMTRWNSSGDGTENPSFEAMKPIFCSLEQFALVSERHETTASKAHPSAASIPPRFRRARLLLQHVQ